MQSMMILLYVMLGHTIHSNYLITSLPLYSGSYYRTSLVYLGNYKVKCERFYKTHGILVQNTKCKTSNQYMKIIIYNNIRKFTNRN
jgi:hypothetical protein